MNRRPPFRRRTDWSDDTGSLALAMLLTLVGTLLSAMLVPLVLNQLNSTRAGVERSRALHAAQSGLDVALGQIRAANDGAGQGSLAKLPCDTLTGGLGAGSNGRYEVVIRYYHEDPQNRSAVWLNDNAMACVSPGGVGTTPAYALLEARGTDAATGSFDDVKVRALKGTYTFQTSNQNIAGSLIHAFKTDASTDLCMDAGSGSPAAGTNLQMQPCSAGSIRQKFAYTKNLTLVLVSSMSEANAAGMCLDVALPHAAGKVVQLQPCVSPVVTRQQWSLNDQANFEGTNDLKKLSGLCFNVQNPNVTGSFLVLGVCGMPYDIRKTFSPEAAVGAGAAGAAVGQLVNFKQFGRCLDVPSLNVNYAYLIAWPCKQAPNPADVTWNQKFALPVLGTNNTGTGKIVTTKSGVASCLTSPGSTSDGQYVRVYECPTGTLPGNMTWTVFGNTGSYTTSYRIKDNTGLCLTARDQDAVPSDYHSDGQQIAKIQVATCGGSTLQKWNAPPNILLSTPIKDIGEK